MSTLRDTQYTAEAGGRAEGNASEWGNPRLTEDQVYGTPVCVKCGKEAITWCPSCSSHEVGDIRVFYCGEVCQRMHEEDHQQHCLAFRRLGRAMQILTELWTDFEVATSTGDFRLTSIADLEVSTEDISPWEVMSGRSVFVPFYKNRQVATSSPRATRAMLFHGKSSEPFTTGLPLVTLILEDLGTLVQNNVTTKHPALKVQRHTNTPEPPRPASKGNHEVIMILLRDRTSQYVIDLTGSQYGWEEVLYPYIPYLLHRCQKLHPVHSIASGQQQHVYIQELIHDSDEIIRASRSLREKIIAKMVSGCREFLKGRNATMASFLTLPEEHYLGPWREFVQVALDVMRKEIRDMNDRGIGRLYLRGDRVRVAMTPETVAKCKHLWITREELKKLEFEDVRTLRQRWLETFPRT